MIGAAEASWTRGVVERRGDYLRRMVSKVLTDGVTLPDMQTLVSHLCAAKNMMSRIRSFSPSQWALATQPRLPEVFMIEDEADDATPFRNIEGDDVSEFANTVRLRVTARRAFVAADTDARLRRAVVARTRPDRLVYSTGDRIYYWRNGAWHPQSAVMVSQVGAGHYFIDSGGRVFKVAAEHFVPSANANSRHGMQVEKDNSLSRIEGHRWCGPSSGSSRCRWSATRRSSSGC